MNEKLLDMHTHTCYSDGELTPDDLIKKASSEGIKTIAITDHDTLLGVQNITINPADYNIEVIPGIEISVKVPVGRMHVLGHNIDIWDPHLNERMKELHNRSLYSVTGVICQLKKDHDIVFSTEEILEILNKERNIGRPDIARLLLKHGYVSSVNEAFDKYLNEAYERCGNVAKGISKKDCIELIKSAHGFATLAHPYSLKLSKEELDAFVKELVDYGLDGIEVYHSNHTPEMTEEYLHLANKYNLLISGGSDYHGPTIKPDVNLGTGKNNIKVKQLTLLDSIHRSKN